MKEIRNESIKDAFLLHDIMDVEIWIDDGNLTSITFSLSNGRDIQIESFPEDHSAMLLWDITKDYEAEEE
jgi:hypothetical protein